MNEREIQKLTREVLQLMEAGYSFDEAVESLRQTKDISDDTYARLVHSVGIENTPE